MRTYLVLFLDRALVSHVNKDVVRILAMSFAVLAAAHIQIKCITNK
jgi:hypothetical protein